MGEQDRQRLGWGETYSCANPAACACDYDYFTRLGEFGLCGIDSRIDILAHGGRERLSCDEVVWGEGARHARWIYEVEQYAGWERLIGDCEGGRMEILNRSTEHEGRNRTGRFAVRSAKWRREGL